jgi:hypothetical protein
MARTGLRSTPTGHLRCSDAEREQVVRVLRDHTAEGRLTPDELADRVALAYRAVTIGDLERLIDDLPGPWPVRAQSWRPAGRRRPALVGIAGVALCAAVLPGLVWIIALATVLTLAVTVLAVGLALVPLLLAGAAALYALRRVSARGELRWPRG